MARHRSTSFPKELNIPLKAVKHFFLEFYEHKNVDAALNYAADDIEFHGLGAPHTDLWSKEEVRAELLGMTDSAELLHVLSVNLTPRQVAQGVCLVNGSFTLGEESNTLLLEICVVAICREDEDGWRIIQLHTYFPWEEGRYQYDGIFEIQQDYVMQKQKEFWQSRLPGGMLSCHTHAPFGIIGMNDSLLRQLGFQSQLEFQELSGSSVLSIIYPDDVPEFAELCKTQAEEEVEHVVACRMRRKDFSYRWFALRGHIEQDEKYGSMLMCSCNDITQEMQLGAECREKTERETGAKEKLQMVMDNMPGGSYCCQLSGDMQLDYLSDGVCRLTGYSRQEIKTIFDRDICDLIYETDREQYRLTMKKMKEYTHTAKAKYRIWCRDGSLRWVMDTMRSIRHADHTVWLYGLLTDVEQEHATTYQMQRFLNAMPTGIAAAFLQNDGVWIHRGNKKLLKLLGCEKHDEEGKNLREFIQQADLPTFDACMERLRAGDPSGSCQISLTTKKQIHILATAQERIAERVTVYFLVNELDEGEEERTAKDHAPRVEVRTFGYFDVYVDGKPIPFQSAKAKEMLALLVDRVGGYVSSVEIISCLWEDEEANKVTLARCRKVAMRLTEKLREYGIENIVESVNGSRRVVPSYIHCDLYDYLDQKPGSEKLFRGSYLTNYSWGEMTLSNLMMGRE